MKTPLVLALFALIVPVLAALATPRSARAVTCANGVDRAG
jgi:hypothetical protein